MAKTALQRLKEFFILENNNPSLSQVLDKIELLEKQETADLVEAFKEGKRNNFKHPHEYLSEIFDMEFN